MMTVAEIVSSVKESLLAGAVLGRLSQTGGIPSTNKKPQRAQKRALCAYVPPQYALCWLAITGDLQVYGDGLWWLMNTEERGFPQALEGQEQVEQIEQAVREKGQEWLATAEEWVRENPYLAMGIAFAAGLTIAALIAKRD